MVIDFHTHVFPEKLAPRALESLQSGIIKNSGTGKKLPVFADATIGCLRKSMEDNGIDLSVVLPIATTPKQTENINTYAKEITGDGILSFGSVFPGQDGWEKIIERLADDGFAGIKLHLEFQKQYADSKEVIDVFNKCSALGMTVILHAGVDSGVAPPVHCTPKQLRHALEYTDGSNIIAAHLGGYLQWDDVETYLVGTNIFLDTAMISRFINDEQCARIIKNHGTDKIVCGSDSPWEGQKDNREYLRSIGFTQADLDEFDGNSKRLLRL